ncbi:PEPTIDYL-PROLYL CIS-TRANS ISOMERASE [Salix viminalis]|uniref:PEPTIDYL-PROLYL CIS-TRANS ISOMERASE n=1 Tax=Salix viminalis TaxID=40686 RepID=A0A9Q0TZ37_SALVM|nr:PEPTIDYL-PROLYL CIS-TRANS ISOMERASE [Salix viminalis]
MATDIPVIFPDTSSLSQPGFSISSRILYSLTEPEWRSGSTLIIYLYTLNSATLIFEVELVACKPRKGSSVTSVSEERARLEELKKQREVVAAAKEEEKKRREEAKAAAAARIQSKLGSKKGQGKGKGKGKAK